MIGYVYKTTNLITGRYYIGQHHAEHFEPNKYLGSGAIIKAAIKKYGKDNFECGLLYEAETQDELDKLEVYYIQLYQANNREYGYNIQEGGLSKK